jgi:hypothetical protein
MSAISKAIKTVKAAQSAQSELDAYLESLVRSGDADAEDLATVREWMQLKPSAWFINKTVDEIMGWIPDNLISDLEQLKGANSFQKASGVPSESDLEDAYNWVECSLTGSEKQIAWAVSIAHKHHFAIVQAWKAGKSVPTAASWWIENRNNIVVSLPL